MPVPSFRYVESVPAAPSFLAVGFVGDQWVGLELAAGSGGGAADWLHLERKPVEAEVEAFAEKKTDLISQTIPNLVGLFRWDIRRVACSFECIDKFRS